MHPFWQKFKKHSKNNIIHLIHPELHNVSSAAYHSVLNEANENIRMAKKERVLS